MRSTVSFILATLILITSTLVNTACATNTPNDSSMHFNGFEAHPVGTLTSFEDQSGLWESTTGKAEVLVGRQRTDKMSLRMSGDRCVVQWTPGKTEGDPHELTFWAQRWSKQGTFEFRVEGYDGQTWRELYNGDEAVKVGGYNTQVSIPLNGMIPERIRFICVSQPGRGILIDDVRITRRMPMTVRFVTSSTTGMPVLIGNRHNPINMIVVDAPDNTNQLSIQSITLSLEGKGDTETIETVEVFAAGSRSAIPWRDPATTFEHAIQFGGSFIPASQMTFKAEQPLADGKNYFWVSYRLKPGATQIRLPVIRCKSVSMNDGKTHKVDNDTNHARSQASQRIGYALRNAGDDNVASYRIPGLTTTCKGTLIAVYDVRYNSWSDLPGNIDIGMSRSTDGGLTWEDMKVIGDMGDDPNWSYDGVGDPAVLADQQTGMIWVAGLWSHGQRGWKDSGPGLDPGQTGQLVLFKSDDDGLTWSKPINITEQVKHPEWRLMFNGPGRGITMRNGTLIFAAQFRDHDGVPFSTIIYSKDHGKSWQVGTGAKPDTTEAQVAELHDGSLMLNMRDNRGGSRSVYVTDDLGQTWNMHDSSRSALPEPVCQASLIGMDLEGMNERVLLFSNPAVSDKPRRNMTIKASLDGGTTWPSEHHLLIDAGNSAGYSCLTMIDQNTIGILYEGSRANMTFMRIPLADVIGGRTR